MRYFEVGATSVSPLFRFSKESLTEGHGALLLFYVFYYESRLLLLFQVLGFIIAIIASGSNLTLGALV